MNQRTLLREDYAEPQCLLCDAPGPDDPISAIPQQRIQDKLDEYMSRRDYAGAERHLLYWLEEAKAGRDLRGELMVRGELVGHYRKAGDRENAMLHGEEALALIDRLDFRGTRSAATTYINVATAMNAFEEDEKALALFDMARTIYEGSSSTSPELLGGLYNNMALTLVSLGRYDEAMELYDRAMEMMAEVPGGVLEQAITCLNRADAYVARDGMEAAENRVYDLLDRAGALLRDPSAPHDGYYAFVLEKCAPSFSYYGYFAEAEDLQRQAQEIYERP